MLRKIHASSRTILPWSRTSQKIHCSGTELADHGIVFDGQVLH